MRITRARVRDLTPGQNRSSWAVSPSKGPLPDISRPRQGSTGLGTQIEGNIVTESLPCPGLHTKRGDISGATLSVHTQMHPREEDSVPQLCAYTCKGGPGKGGWMTSSSTGLSR